MALMSAAGAWEVFPVAVLDVNKEVADKNYDGVAVSHVHDIVPPLAEPVVALLCCVGM
jgi:hypothetical protein